MLGRAHGTARDRETGGMVTLRSTLMAFVVVAAATGCSSGSVDSSRLPSCADVERALFHVGMAAPAARPASTRSGLVRTTCTFSSTQRYGLTNAAVLILRPPTDPYEGKSLDDWARDTIAAT